MRLRSYWTLPVAIGALHLAVVYLLCLNNAPPPKSKRAVPIQVHTVRLTTPRPPAAKPEPKRLAKAPLPTPEPTRQLAQPKKKKETTPPPKSTSPPPKKKVSTTSKSSKQREDERERSRRLKEAQETIAKIASKQDKATQSSASPPLSQRIPQLQIDQEGQRRSTGELQYCEEVAQRLKLLLRLPEFGEVKVRLILRRDGSVAKVDIVRSVSAKNSRYVTEKLETASFPGFGTLFPGQDEETFPITLSNE